MLTEDPLLEAAARSLREAQSSLADTVRLLNYRRNSEHLSLIANYLETVADAFSAGRRDEGLALAFVDRKRAGQIMGRNRSVRKLAALAKARAVRAEKRRLAAEDRSIRETACGY